jgi:hypothetical protein
MPIWWVGLAGAVGLGAGLLFSIDGLVAFGAISLIGAGLGFLRAVIRSR